MAGPFAQASSMDAQSQHPMAHAQISEVVDNGPRVTSICR